MVSLHLLDFQRLIAQLAGFFGFLSIDCPVLILKALSIAWVC